MELLKSLLDSYGLPTLLVLTLLYWIDRRILAPLLEHHTRYLDITAAAYTTLAAAFSSMAQSIATRNKILQSLPCLLTPSRDYCPPATPEPKTPHDARTRLHRPPAPDRE